MPPWSLHAVVAALCLTVHYLALRAASGRIGDAWGAFLMEATAAIGILVLVALRAGHQMPATTAGVAWSCVSGLGITGFSVLLFAALRLGAPVSATGPLVYGGGVAIAALLAPLLFGEVFTVRRAIGVALGLASLVLLATERS